MAAEDILKAITNDAKSSIDQMEIVTPSVYASIFSKLAASYDLDIDDEPSLAKDLIDKEYSNIKDLQDKTTNSVNQLNNSTTKAMSAIKEKDEDALNEALFEAQKLKMEVDELRKTVYKDGLTNVNNRKWMYDTLLHRDKFRLAGTLAIIDLNYFKDINDTHGHIVGDKVLIYIAAQLSKSKGTVVRYGGDEFIVIFKQNIPKDEIIKRFENIRNSIINKNLKIKGAAFKVSFSYGIQEFKKDDYLNNVIDNADKHMYRDKTKIKKIVTGI
jgi:diguanylate cyclase (GGDEF)-like protein